MRNFNIGRVSANWDIPRRVPISAMFMSCSKIRVRIAKNFEMHEVVAFFERVHLLRSDVTLFVVDTALRLSDKVLPMLVTELENRRGGFQVTPLRIERELWAVTPHLYAVNGKLDLMANIGRALAEGLFALSPNIVAGR